MKLIIDENSKQLTLSQYLREKNSPLLKEISFMCGGNGTCNRCRCLVNSKVEKACSYVPKKGDVIQTIVSEKPSIETSVRFEYESGLEDGYACAVDIGTTTVVCALLNLNTGKIVDSVSDQNCQSVYGADVISRMGFAVSSPQAKEEIRNVICRQVHDMYTGLQAKHKINMLKRVVIAANTAMIKILLGEDCNPLIKAPFIGSSEGFDGVVDGTDMIVLPGPFSYFGSDLSAGLYAGGFYAAKRPALFVDAGTNGEVALATDKEILFSSSAAGPAFEAAVESGLFGSEIVNVLAQCLNEELVDETGKIDGDNVPFSQKEIRDIQLAKGAVAATVSCLMKKAGVQDKDLETVFLAGGFGSALNVESAIRIGLLPEVSADRFKVLGNASLGGACMVACKPEMKKEVSLMINKGTYVELFHDSMFNNEFMEKMMFE